MTPGSLTEHLQETLALFEDAAVPLTTTEVADRLGLGRRSTYDRLDRLVDHDRLETKKVGANARVWWRPTGAGADGRRREDRDLDRRIMDVVPLSVFLVDADGDVVEANDRFRERTGIDDVAAGPSIDDLDVYDESGALVPPEERPCRTVGETGKAVSDWRCQVELPSGARRWLSLTVTPLGEGGGDGDGAVDRVVVAARDVTRQRRLERRCEDLEGELSAVFDRIDDAFFALDEEWRFVHVNDRAATLLERSIDELVGRHVREAFPETNDSTFREQFERALDAREPVTFEEQYPPLDARFEVSAYPSEDGLSVYLHDVTERTERERELEESRRHYRTLVEHFPNGAVALVDDDLRFVTLGGEPMEEVDATRDELEGRPVREALPPAVADRLVPRYEAALDGERSTFEERLGDHHYQIRVLPVRDADGEVFAAMGMSQDVTGRTERERDLELYETIVSTIEDGVYVLDGEFRFVKVNDAYVEMTGYDREELLGSHCSLVVDEEVAAESAEILEGIQSGEASSGAIEADIDRADGSHLRAESRFSALSTRDGDDHWKVGVVRDVTERANRERELRTQLRQQEVVGLLGRRALEDRDLDALMADAADLVADALDADYCKVLDLDAGAGKLRLRQGTGGDGDAVGETTVAATDDDSQAAHALRTGGPVVVTDLDAETRFEGTDPFTDHDVRSGISTVVGPRDDPWGVLGAHDTTRREFAEHDVTFVQSVATVLASTIARHEHERELVRQRERVRALNNLNRIVREITGEVIEQSTREEIEETVCRHLAESDSYLFAWIGEIDVGSKTVRLRTEAGVEGYLDDMTVFADSDEVGAGRTSTACETGEIQVVQEIDPGDVPRDRLRAHAAEYGFRSFATVPIVHDGSVYGALDVYAERPMAFEKHERTVLAQLGEVVGHAIAAAERKRTLMSDEMIALEFYAPDVFDDLDVEGGTPGRITIEHAIPVEDDEHLVYGRTTPDGIDGLRTLAEELPDLQGVTVRDRDGTARFELRLSEPPILSEIAALGGSIDEAILEDGDYRLRIHVAPGADVRNFIETVEEAHPAVHLLRRQRITRSDDPSERLGRVLTEELTERQRITLEAAYHAGHFAWPQDASGEDVAAALGIAPSTFHQHLRKAERKVFDHVLSTGPTSLP